jgi:N-acetylglucosamine-6-phosphate deacetylase
MSIDGEYFDLQVNGYGGVDFNEDQLTAEHLHTACERLQADGVAGILATIVTEQIDLMCQRLARLVQLREADPLARQMIQGLHIEGPFINESPGYRGAHPADAIRPADVELMRRLLEGGGGLVRLVTLAPERDAQMRVVRFLARQGIAVAIAHSDASLDQLKQAIDAGLSVATHLGNGCPLQMQRHDNIIQRVLSLSEQLTICLIADGVHVPFFALGNYIRCAGVERCVVVSDAMAAAGMGPGRYRVGRWDLVIGEDLAAWAPDRTHLVGSAGTMRRSEAMLAEQLKLSEQARRMLLDENPRRVCGLLNCSTRAER